MQVSIFHLLIAAILSGKPEGQPGSLIEWKAERKLVWSDFKAAPDPGMRAAALSGTSIQVDFEFSDLSMNYHIRCAFDQNHSWGRVRNGYILSHEQLHFDIAELYARKLNKALGAYKGRGKKAEKEVNSTYQEIMRSYRHAQEQYDRETDFSINRGQQSNWSAKIKMELNEWRNYGHYR
jgi:Bacterial protein of unknown function (DUF922)